MDFPHKGQWRGALMFSLICACTNGWASNRDASDLRHHRVHCNAIAYEIPQKNRKGTLYNVKNILPDNKVCWDHHPCESNYLPHRIDVRINTLRPRQNGRHFADDIFKCIFLNENVWILIKISLKFVPKGPINNIPALVQIMAWRRPGDKPLSEPMMGSSLTHICVTRPQWVKGAVSYRFSQGLLTLMCNNPELKADINFFFFLLRRQTS